VGIGDWSIGPLGDIEYAILKLGARNKRGGARKNAKIASSETPLLTPEILARAIVRRGLMFVPRKRQLIYGSK